MNKANLKSYAPQARLDFIAAVTARANLLGIASTGISTMEMRGDVAIIDGREWPARIKGQREKLVDRISRHGFDQTMEEVAYTWFNRFAALRYMEIHDYLDHGWRVLSSRDGGQPEILRHASEVLLPGLSKERALELQLAGNQDDELFRNLLVAQCNQLSVAMPFLFERIDDQTELLLPENLLRTDSILSSMVSKVPEEDWQNIEVVGWLYQYYISDKKAEVIGKVVASEDIPAATQLFTPNWIVKYLVQNSIGRLWLDANNSSRLKETWSYFVAPTNGERVVEWRNALVKQRIQEDGESLNPETMRLLDPACGSGHILVEAYDIFKAIYLERGYRLRDVPRLILEKNLFGLDLDDRAAQMAGFALTMKARLDDRKIFSEPPRMNVLSLQESNALDAEQISQSLKRFGVSRLDVSQIVNLFKSAKTYGSLLTVPDELVPSLRRIEVAVLAALEGGDLYAKAAAEDLLGFVRQALILSQDFDAVVANPPYMSNKGLNDSLKSFGKSQYPDSKADIFAMFIERCVALTKPTGSAALVTMQSWMFLSSFETLRGRLLAENTIHCLAHFPYENRTPTAMGINFGISAFVLDRTHVDDYVAHFCCGHHHELDEDGKPFDFPPKNPRNRQISSTVFEKIPGNPISYWINPGLQRVFENGVTLESLYPPKTGMTTGDDGRFLRQWFEVSADDLNTASVSSDDALRSGKKWFPYNKGGIGNKWFGHCNYVVNWKNDGADIKHWVVNNPNDPNTTSWSRRIFNHEFFFKQGLTWTLLNSRTFNVRFLPSGSILNVNGPTISFSEMENCHYILGFLNSKVAAALVQVINPTAANNPGDVGKLPLLFSAEAEVSRRVGLAIDICKASWDESETSFDFKSFPMAPRVSGGLESGYDSWRARAQERIAELRAIEEKNNSLFIQLYGLESEMDPSINAEDITIGVWSKERWAQGFVSYFMGCNLGRFSTSRDGIHYAGKRGLDFEQAPSEDFLADADGIVPVTDEAWFADDSAERISKFLAAVVGVEHVSKSVEWLGESLGRKNTETPIETIRRYLADKFFKDHTQLYRKRPIYWLFSSGKQGAFQALVYMHRYNEGTLSRMRSEYVIPLSAKFIGRLEMLEKDAAASSSAAARTKIQKQIESLRKKQAELLAYDEKLRHYADMRISIDLDDGVKANYSKFGDLVAESKAITGGSDE